MLAIRSINFSILHNFELRISSRFSNNHLFLQMCFIEAEDGSDDNMDSDNFGDNEDDAAEKRSAPFCLDTICTSI